MVPIIELSFHFDLNWFQLPCQSVDLDLEVDPDFGQGWLAINNQEVAMVAGVVERTPEPGPGRGLRLWLELVGNR